MLLANTAQLLRKPEQTSSVCTILLTLSLWNWESSLTWRHTRLSIQATSGTRDGKTYFVVNDYEALRGLFGELLAEVQRIKSEGDYKAGKALIETYAVNIDPALHKEVKERYAALNLRPYGGFLNPEIVPVEKGGKVVDYKIVYNDSYIDQMLQYGKKYSTL